MLESQTAESLRTKIKDAPHWRVVIRPGEHVQERISNLSQCWNLVESCRVSLRGWDYPHIGPEHRNNGKDWIESWDEYGSHREYWRFYQSGQFLHLFAFKEDQFRDKAEAKAKGDVPTLKGLTPSGYLGVLSVLWTITEIFEFAARLAQKANFDDSVSVTIQMVGVKNRVLYESEARRDFFRPYIARESTLSKEWSLKTEQLLSEPSELALNATEWFFERFQWMSPPRQVLANDQRRLLERKF